MLHDNILEFMFFSILQQSAYQTMNEVSGGKQDVPNTSNWEALSEQSVSSLPAMHHHHQTLQQDTNSPITQIIVPIPIRLQPPILTPIQTVADHWQQLDHIEESPFITRGTPPGSFSKNSSYLYYNIFLNILFKKY